jgi:glyoxylase-like metal-dependent hydrolase (beta-lactamase superfamily II)
MTVLSHGLSFVDLEFLGRPHAIASGIVQSSGGVAVVDPGPTTCLSTLDLGLQRHGVRWNDVRHILLTHIHLDHSGATGTIVREHPHISVFVHERGTPHMADPQKLIDSAARLYGTDMNRLWGEIAPVPAANLVTLRGGERIDAGGRSFEVAYTPGHASHHVSYLDRSSGVAFVGDVAGVRIDGGFVLPPTPPPDIDLEKWRGSLDAIEAWSPDTIFLTHFGPAGNVRPHLETLWSNLQEMAGWVRQTLDEPGSDEQRSRTFADRLKGHMRKEMSDVQIAAYPVAAPFEQLWLGLARYWRKKAS